MSGSRRHWRLLQHGRGEGAWNMAVDEALLDSVVAGGRPTLRLYGFRPAALSLGRNQPADGAHDPEALRRLGIDLIRRPTGGLAVLHDEERTYAVVGRLDRPPFDGGVAATYRAVARSLADALGALGLVARPADGTGSTTAAASAACFAATGLHEIVVGGRKIVGSAQLRRRSAFLQHGSILLRSDPDRLAQAIGAEVPDRFTDLERELSRSVDPAAIDAAVVASFSRLVGQTPVPGELDDRERRHARDLRERKYAARSWTWGGVSGE